MIPILRAPLSLIALSVLVAACVPSASVPSPSAPGTTGQPSGTIGPEPSIGSSTAHGHTLGSDASVSYDGFRVWAGQSQGVALVQVSDIGPLRWNSISGERPDEGALHSAPRDHRDSYNIGRLITVERVRLVAGRSPTTTSTFTYWRPGGALGPDSFDAALPAPVLSVGDRAIALLTEADAGADGPIPVQVGWLFPLDDTGRVVTLNPNEKITLENLASFVP